MSGESERANGLASCPVLRWQFFVIWDHNGLGEREILPKCNGREESGKWICILPLFRADVKEKKTCYPFLDATTHLFKRSCPSVGPSVRPSACPVLFPNDDYGRF